jgi:hypothetical protein
LKDGDVAVQNWTHIIDHLEAKYPEPSVWPYPGSKALYEAVTTLNGAALGASLAK